MAGQRSKAGAPPGAMLGAMLAAGCVLAAVACDPPVSRTAGGGEDDPAAAMAGGDPDSDATEGAGGGDAAAAGDGSDGAPSAPADAPTREPGDDAGTAETDAGTDGGAAGGGGEVTAPEPSRCSDPVQTNRGCRHNHRVLLGKYWLFNNLWGGSEATGEQCLWSTCSSEPIGWGTRWDWSDPNNALHSVKSFSSVVLGWHWGWMVSPAQTGLPIQLSQGARSVECSWRFDVEPGGTMNVAYDLWLHSVPDPDMPWSEDRTVNDPTDEVMIWLYREGGAGPLGTVVESGVQLAGAEWDLYRGDILDGGEVKWTVHSFLRTSNTTSATLEMMRFLDHLVATGAVPDSRYLTSVEAGTEVFTGAGRLDTTAYRCRTP